MVKDLYKFEDWNDISEHQRIGDILLSCGKINLLHLAMALDAQKFQRVPLGVMFVVLKIISKEELAQTLLVQRYIDDRISSGIN